MEIKIVSTVLQLTWLTQAPHVWNYNDICGEKGVFLRSQGELCCGVGNFFNDSIDDWYENVFFNYLYLRSHRIYGSHILNALSHISIFIRNLSTAPARSRKIDTEMLSSLFGSKLRFQQADSVYAKVPQTFVVQELFVVPIGTVIKMLACGPECCVPTENPSSSNWKTRGKNPKVRPSCRRFLESIPSITFRRIPGRILKLWLDISWLHWSPFFKPSSYHFLCINKEVITV